jgi:hypothetical protein
MTAKKRDTIIKHQTKGIFDRPGSAHLMEESYSLRYDYRHLDKETSKQLKDQTIQIRTLYTQSLNNVIQIGKFLYNVKYNVLSRGEYLAWLKSEFEEPGYFSHDTASNFINAYLMCEKFGKKYGGIDKLKPLNLNTIYVMSRRSVPDSAQEEIIDRIQEGESLKRDQVQKIIRQHKFKQKAIDALAVDVNEDQNQKSLELSKDNSESKSKTKGADVNPTIVEDLNTVDKVDLIIHELPKSIYYNQVEDLFNQAQEKLDNKGFLLFICGNQFYLREIISYYELFELSYLSLISFKVPPKNDFELNIHSQLLHSILLYKGDKPHINNSIEDLYESKDEVFKLINSLLYNKSSKKIFHRKHF